MQPFSLHIREEVPLCLGVRPHSQSWTRLLEIEHKSTEMDMYYLPPQSAMSEEPALFLTPPLSSLSILV